MNKKGKKAKKLWQKLLEPYLLVIINEENFEERAQIRTSKGKIILLSLILLTFFSAIIFTTLSYTPLKELIPGYDSSEVRKKAIQNLFLTDSLITIYDQNIQYLNSVRKVLTEDISYEESKLTDKEIENQNKKKTPKFKGRIFEDSLLRAFVSQQDKYSPVLSEELVLNTFLFPPVKGIVSQPFDLNKSHFAVDVAVEENTPIKNIADGTVVFSEWTAETGFVIIIKHNFGLLSIYKHNSSLNKKQGDLASAGEVIAMAGNTGEYTTGFHLHFELWMDDYPMNPENFFNFSKE